MSASNLDRFVKGAKNWVGAIGAGGVSDAVVTTVPLVSTTNLPTDTAVEITIDRVDANGTETPSKMEVVKGVVSSNNIIDCLRGVEGTAQAHSAGAIVEVMLTASQFNSQIDAILEEHNQDGTHTDAIARTTDIPVKATGAEINTGTDDAKFATSKAIKDSIIFNSPQGFLLNGKICSVSRYFNNLTVAIKTLAGTDPSATDPVYCRIGDTVRAITSALSVTKNAGTNWCNAGSAELATKEIDYFVYLGYNATDGVVIGFSRIPHACSYDDFSATTTNEKYCAISTITTASATDYYENIGRFGATLSAGAGYTWTVPTFTAKNLIQRPIYKSRSLDITPVWTGFSANPTGGVYKYQVDGNMVFLQRVSGSSGTSNATTTTLLAPFAFKQTAYGMAMINGVDNGVNLSTICQLETTAGSNIMYLYKTYFRGAWTNSGSKDINTGVITYEI
jgi:hypothetical protein